MTPTARRVLELRQVLAKSSVSKLGAFAERTGPDGRLQNELKYYGAHTGRWSGTGVQIQNFPRGTLKADAYDQAVEMIRSGTGAIEDPLNVVSSCLRAAVRAPEGQHLVVADLSQIEVRVLAWLSGCPRLTEVFERDVDPYIDFASRWLGKPPEAVTKDERQTAKPAVLACGFGQGPGKEAVDKNGDAYYTGLRGYAERMGITLSDAQATDLVYSYRSIYWHVTKLWEDLQSALFSAVAYGDTRTVGKVTIGCIQGKLLWVALPSGRRLHYLRPAIDGTDVTYRGWLGTKLVPHKMWYGELVNNCVQGIARDVMAHGMLAADAAGFTIVGSVHDELICLEAVDDGAHGPDQLVACMTQRPAWGDGLLVKADGWAGPIYRK